MTTKVEQDTLAFEALANAIVGERQKNTQQDLAIQNAQNTANGAAVINDAAPASETSTLSANKISTDIATARAEAIAEAATETTNQIAAALEGEDLSDLADAVTQVATDQMDLATASSVAALATTVGDNTAAITQNTNAIAAQSAAIGDLSTYDPLGAVQAILNA